MNELEIRPKDAPTNLIIVEDDEIIGAMALTIGRAESCNTTLMTSAEEAFKRIEEIKACDILLLDIHLPGKDGEWLCREVRQEIRQTRNPHDPAPTPWIIAHTTETRPEKIEKLLKGGINDHLGKPLEPAKLSIKLRVACYNIARIRALKLRIKNLELQVLESAK